MTISQLAVAERGSSPGFCLTWPWQGERNGAVRSFPPGRAEGPEHGWPGQGRPSDNSAVRGLLPLKLQVSHCCPSPCWATLSSPEGA